MASGGTELGYAYLQVMPSAKGFGNNLKNALNGETSGVGESAGSSIGSSLVKTIKNVIVAAGIGKVISQALKEGGSLEQSFGGIETMFKGSADKVKGYAAEAFKTVGISANEYMEQVTSFSARLMQSLGDDTDTAADIANMAMIDMGNNANKFGTSMESIQNAYQGFAKANYTMLDNLKLGYGGTASEMARLINDSGVMGKTFTATANNLNKVSFDKMIEAIHVMQDRMEISGTTAEEAARTFQGSAAAMGAAWQNVLGYISTGSPEIAGAIQGLAESVGNYLQNLLPMVSKIVQALPGALLTALTEVAPVVMNEAFNFAQEIITGATENLTAIGESVTKIIGEFVNFILTKLPELLEAGRTMISELAHGFADNLPALVDQVMPTVVALVTEFTNQMGQIIDTGIEIIMALLNGIIEALPQLIEYVPTIITTWAQYVIDNLPKILKAGWEIIKALVKGVIEMLPLIWQAIKDIVSGIIQIIAETDWVQKGIEIITWIKDGIVNMVTALPDKMGEIIEDVKKKITEIDWLKIGKDIINGIKNGISNVASNLASTALSAVKGAWNSMTNWLGIHSPSRKARDIIGKNWALGVGLGFEQNIPTEDMLGSVRDSFNEISKEGMIIPLTTGKIPAIGTNPVQNPTTIQGVNINVYASDNMDVRELAEKVSEEITKVIRREGAVFA